MREINSVYPRLNVIFKFLYIRHKFFARVCFFMTYLAWKNFVREKWPCKLAKNLLGFVFVLVWNLVFMCKVSQPRIYPDLLRFQSRVKDPIHIIILMNIITFFIHFFHLLTLVYEQSNQRIICNISDKNNKDSLFTSI